MVTSRLPIRAALLLIALVAASTGLARRPAEAGEGGLSVYLPGSRDFAAGAVPGPGTYVRNDFIWVADKRLERVPRIGRVDADFEINAFIDLARVTHVTKAKVLGGSYAFGALLPVGFASFTGRHEASGVRFRDEDFGIGDLVVTPAAIGWHCKNIHTSVYTSVYAPTGSYSTSSAVNIGKNHWAWDIGGGFSWIDPERGHEISLGFGYLVNFENPATKYTSGQELHVDFLVGQHFSKRFTAGVAGYWLTQITGDSGQGAVLGSFRGHAFGLGPAIQYGFTIGRKPCSLIAKAYWDIEVRNRVKGRSFWLGFSAAL